VHETACIAKIHLVLRNFWNDIVTLLDHLYLTLVYVIAVLS
jgi:hypothetical protein